MSFYLFVEGPVVLVIFMIVDLSGDRLTPGSCVGCSPCYGTEWRCHTRCHPDLCGTTLYLGGVVPTFAGQRCTRSASSRLSWDNTVLGQCCPDLRGTMMYLGGIVHYADHDADVVVYSGWRMGYQNVPYHSLLPPSKSGIYRVAPRRAWCMA